MLVRVNENLIVNTNKVIEANLDGKTIRLCLDGAGITYAKFKTTEEAQEAFASLLPKSV